MPDSKLYLLKAVDELDPDYEFALDFDNISDQDAYFDKKIESIIPISGYTYIRRNESIRVDANIDELNGINYLFYVNEDGKRYYCFITDKKYVNNDTTEIHVKLDVFQTYMFNYTLGECFVEREHQDRFSLNQGSNKLNPIYNTIEENLDYGNEYLTSTRKEYPYQLDDGSVILFLYIYRKVTTEDRKTYVTNINEIRQGYAVFVQPFIFKRKKSIYENFYKIQFKHKDLKIDIKRFLAVNFLDDPSTLQMVISPFSPQEWNLKIDDANKIISLSTLIGEENNIYEGYNSDKDESQDRIIYCDTITNDKDLICPIGGVVDSLSEIPRYDHTSTRSKYRESKLNTYPYKFTKINLNGTDFVIKNEYLDKETHSSYVTGFQSLSISANSCVKINNYLTNTNKDSNINVVTNQIPSYIDLSTDAWSKYILENKAQRTAGYVNGAVSTLGGVALGGASSILKGELASVVALSGAQTALGGIGSIGSQLAKEHDIKHQPHDARQFSGDLNMTEFLNEHGIIYNEYEITSEYLNRIYNFFYHYGYKVSDFKVPDTRSRYYFNYIKNTQTTFRHNRIDSDYINQLKEIYNKGITIWHSRNGVTPQIFHYDLENAEMTLEGGANV